VRLMKARLFAVLSAVALIVIAAIPASASNEGHSYLALGDSVPFGFNPNPALWPNISNFIGYPEIVAQRLHIEDVNASCPGEATGGFLSMGGTDNGCHPYRTAYPLHVAYSGTQMAFATSYLRTHPETRLVTLTLGANDFFHLQNVCADEFKADLDDAAADIAVCVGAGIPSMLGTMAANLNTIFAGIRATGYTGLIVAVTYYSLTYPDTSGADLLNGPMIAVAKSYGAVIASGVEAWRATATAAGGSSCAAGLLLPAYPPVTGTCDVHPTPLGRDLLANQVISAIAATCRAKSAIGCLNRSQV
jgi:lysophospholipase L1-like esterase